MGSNRYRESSGARRQTGGSYGEGGSEKAGWIQAGHMELDSACELGPGTLDVHAVCQRIVSSISRLCQTNLKAQCVLARAPKVALPRKQIQLNRRLRRLVLFQNSSWPWLSTTFCWLFLWYSGAAARSYFCNELYVPPSKTNQFRNVWSFEMLLAQSSQVGQPQLQLR